MPELTTIGFDADDTLWHNERVFRLTQSRFKELLAPFADGDVIETRLLETERRNLSIFGYGVKGFGLSLMETAIELTDGRIDGRAMAQILSWCRDMLTHPVESLPHARQTLKQLEGSFRLVLVTKGDLFDQERKLAESGLADFFNGVEIVSEKTPEVYRTVFDRHGHGPDRAMMVGNSLKSDIWPMLQSGGWGVHVPYEVTWALEQAERPESHERFAHIDNLGELSGLIERLT